LVKADTIYQEQESSFKEADKAFKKIMNVIKEILEEVKLFEVAMNNINSYSYREKTSNEISNMSIDYAILGILSSKSLTGYDLKKIIQESPFMYWSGNNNQIYRSLVKLHDKGFVTNEVEYQESSPSKKVYTITKEGISELKDWVLSSPEPPEFKKMFLIQLAWSDQLNSEELSAIDKI